MKVLFITTGSINKLATLKRVKGMLSNWNFEENFVRVLVQDTEENREYFDNFSEYILYFKVSFVREILSKYLHINGIKYDVYYVLSPGLRNVLPLILRGSKGVAVEHSELMSVVDSIGRFKRIQYRIIEGFVLRRYKRHFVANYGLIDRFRSRFPHSDYIYFPYAYDRSHNVIEIENSNSFRLFYMGTLRANYGLFHMINAAAKARNTVFTICGQGDCLDDAKALIVSRNYHHINILGYIEEDVLENHMMRADAFILPLQNSEQDQYRCPSKLFAYISYNKPILTSPIGEVERILGKEYPYYYESFNDKECAELIEKLETERKDYVYDIDVSWKSIYEIFVKSIS